MFHILTGRPNLPLSSSFEYNQYAASFLSLFSPLLFLNLILTDSFVLLLLGLSLRVVTLITSGYLLPTTLLSELPRVFSLSGRNFTGFHVRVYACVYVKPAHFFRT